MATGGKERRGERTGARIRQRTPMRNMAQMMQWRRGGVEPPWAEARGIFKPSSEEPDNPLQEPVYGD
jgi:hypothetical protein